MRDRGEARKGFALGESPLKGDRLKGLKVETGDRGNKNSVNGDLPNRPVEGSGRAGGTGSYNNSFTTSRQVQGCKEDFCGP